MDFSREIISKIKVEMNLLPHRRELVVARDDAKKVTWAVDVVNRIPTVIAAAIVAGVESAELCEVTEYESGAFDPGFYGERLFFVKQPLYESEGTAWPELSTLIGAAELVFRFCVVHGLCPTFTQPEIRLRSAKGVESSWEVKKMMINWRADRMHEAIIA
jgi:hypothetical protein